MKNAIVWLKIRFDLKNKEEQEKMFVATLKHFTDVDDSCWMLLN